MREFHKVNAASLLASSCDYFVTVFLKELLHWEAVAASITGTVAGGIINFLICRHWAFSAGASPAFQQGKRYFFG